MRRTVPNNYQSKDWKTISHNVRFVLHGGRCADCGQKVSRHLLDTSHDHYGKGELKARCRSCHSRFDAKWRVHKTLTNRFQKAGQLPLPL